MRALVLTLLAGLLGCQNCTPSDDGWGTPANASDALVLEGQPVETDFDGFTGGVQSLDGTWRFQKDPNDVGLDDNWFQEDVDRSDWEERPVPGTYGRLPDGTLDTYEGVAWYATDFQVDAADPAADLIRLRVGACFLTCRYWLNGVELATVERPYLPVLLNVTEHLRMAGNTLVVRVDNRLAFDTLPADTSFNPGRHGWWPYGGITRPVTLVRTARAYVYEIVAIPRMTPGGDDVTIRIGVAQQLGGSARIGRLLLRVLAPDGSELMRKEGQDVVLPNALNRFEVSHRLAAQRWSRGTPGNLYTAEVTLETGGVPASWSVKFGFREVGTTPTRITLNGDAEAIYGISRHEDDPLTGPVQSPQHLAQDLALLEELGVNHIRPGHYPADERFMHMLRDAGITITEEIPVYQWDGLQMGDPTLVEKAHTYLKAMVQRDRNNPAIIAWSLMNEVYSWDPAAYVFSRDLNALAKSLTPDRLTTYALQVVPGTLFPDEHVAENVDAIGANQYYGWYYGVIADVAMGLNHYRAKFPDKPMYISEFGADAERGRISGMLEPEPYNDHSYAEDWQAWFLSEQLREVDALGFVAGVMPWVWADFYYEWDPPTGEHPFPFMNLKGLLTIDRQKKQSFETVKQAYQGRVLDN